MLELHPSSFRDRDARVFEHQGKIYRCLSEKSCSDWAALQCSKLFATFVEKGSLARTAAAPDSIAKALHEHGKWAGVLEHERLPFISYPYEWCFAMLRDAAALHLELLEAALKEDLIIKDSSAFNIAWRGIEPVFIDISSFERLPAGEIWRGYRQFCQMFLFPLILQAYKEVPFQPFLRGNIDGIESAVMLGLMSIRDLLRAGVFKHVFLQAKLENRYAATSRNLGGEIKNAGFQKELILVNVRGLRKLIQGLRWRRAHSAWSSYTDANRYDEPALNAKKEFVERSVTVKRRELVWDLGCNTGVFSRLAAKHAGYVLAADADHLCVELLYRALRSEGVRNVHPLVLNVANPSPNQGWRGMERSSLEMRGRPSLLLCLALIHHVVITANIPLAEFIAWLASLGGDLVIEFVSREDPMVKQLLLNKADNYGDYEREHFEKELQKSYLIVQREELLEGARVLYYCQR